MQRRHRAARVLVALGVLDMAGFPKDDYWYYRAWWQQGNETVTHIVPDDWTQWSTGDKVEVCRR